jgi:hypothetical protein
MTSTQTPTQALTITVIYEYAVGPTSPEQYKVWGEYASEEDRDAALAGFPKNLKLEACNLENSDRTKYAIAAYGNLKSKKGNPINETSQRRLSALLDLIQYDKGIFQNAYTTADEARAACL